MIFHAGAHLYHKMPATAFDDDWDIGNEPALRWFCRACEVSDKLTDHQACGNPTYDSRRDTVTRTDYMKDVNTGEFNSGTKGVYFTPNLFYRWRNQDHLKGLTAHWLEIDTKGHNALTEDEALRVLDEVAKVLWLADVPMATNIVTTGSGGVHLYWTYDAPQMTRSTKHRQKLIERWREISKAISSRFEAKRKQLGYNTWSVDQAASHNPSGNMRLPSSRHHKTWREVEYYRGGEQFKPQDLVNQLGFKWKYPCGDDFEINTPRAARPASSATPLPKVFVRANTQSAPDKATGVAQGFDSSGQQHWMRGLMQQWVDFLAMARPDLTGQRDLTAFHLYNMANRVMGSRDAWNYIEQVNNKYIGLPDRELKAYLSTAASTVYYYGMGRLSRILSTELGLPLDFSYSKKKAPLDAKEIVRRQVKSGKVSSRKKKERTLEALTTELHAFLAKYKVTPTQVKLSKKLRTALLKDSKLKRATFYRYIKKALQAAMNKVMVTIADLTLLSQNKGLIRSPFSYNAFGEVSRSLNIRSLKAVYEIPYSTPNLKVPKPPD